MKKLILYAMVIFPCSLMAQIGIKAGLNFANVTNASDINSSSETGFHGGIFLAPPSKSFLASRTEFLFSRQGYNYSTNTNTGNVNLDYIMLPQFMAFNITKFVQLQVGFQIAYLVSAKADSTSSSGEYGAYGNIMDLYNRFDYGLGGGVEIHPISGLLVGARINVSFGDLYSTDPEDYANGQPPSFIPKVDVKNNVFQLFVGWRFGKQPESKKKEKKENKEP
ncbi:MAG TPA: porin family protein [Chitinophagaceae bacterium]|nr:porin family protein [Chitinophagaceae bacterium]